MIKKLKDQKIESFVKDLASASATPGGGAVAALSAAFSAALIGMVANLTIGKKGYEDFQEEMYKLLKDSKNIQKRLLDLADEDVLAFNKVMNAYKLDKNDPKRSERIQKSLKYATAVPLETAKLSVDLIKMAPKAMKMGNKNAFSDAKTAKNLSRASYLSALENVSINLKFIEDGEYIESVKEEIKKMEESCKD